MLMMNLFSLSVSLSLFLAIHISYTYSQHLYQQHTRTHTPPALLCWPLANLFTFCSMPFDIDVKINAFLSLKTLLTTSVDTFLGSKNCSIFRHRRQFIDNIYAVLFI